MKDYGLGVLEQYHIELYGTRKTRGAVLCDTKQGLFLLKEVTFSEKRIPLLYKICGLLEEQGFHRIDTIVPNIREELISTAEDHTKYILKKWFPGRECDVRKEQNVVEAARNLAELHMVMQTLFQNMTEWTEELCYFQKTNLEEEFMKHGRELRKVRSFMRERVTKGDFELLFLKHYEEMEQRAEAMCEKLKQSGYQKLYQDSLKNGSIVHGDYNYHNVLMTDAGAAATNFERFECDVVVSDLYYFLRKVMEKYTWKAEVGAEILRAYTSVRSLNSAEYEYLAIRLSYPEKYWKMANCYYYSNKAWIPAKNVDKLKMTIEQSEIKRLFLEEIFSFHL